MRALTPEAVAILAGNHVPMAMLVEMDLTAPLFLNTSPLDLDVLGTIYYGTRGMGKIGPLADTPAEVRGIQFDLSGVRSDSLAMALAEPVQGKAVRIKLAILRPANYTVVEVHQRWSGSLDVMGISESGGAATISVSSEHVGIDLARPASSLYTNAEQQRLHPGDLFLQFMAEQVDRRVVWPTREFFKK